MHNAVHRVGDASRSVCAVFLLALVFCPGLRAEDSIDVIAAYHPGETIHIVVSLQRPAKLSSLSCQFRLAKLEVASQQQYTTVINSNSYKAFSDTDYEVSAVVPDYAASGIYRLLYASTAVPELTKEYNVPSDLGKTYTIKIINEKADPLPNIKDIKIVPPK